MACSVDAKLLKSTKFPPEFNQKVDMQKVNAEVMKKWIAGKISEILGNDDDVVIELCFNLIEGSRYPDIKKTQIQLTGFLDKDTAGFCKELWKLCLSAQENPQGVPKELLEAKKLELIQEKLEAGKAAEEARKKREAEQHQQQDNSKIRSRQNEREDRSNRGERGEYGDRNSRGGRRDSWRGGFAERDIDRRRIDRYSGRAFDRRSRRYSRSPPPRQRDSREMDSFRPIRGPDTYIPPHRFERRKTSISDSRSSSATRSRSRSPVRRRPQSPSRNRSPIPRRKSITPPRRVDSYRGRGERSAKGKGFERRAARRSPSYTNSSRSRSYSRSPSPAKRRRPKPKTKSPSPSISRRARRARSRSRSSSTSRSPTRTHRRRRSRSRARTRASPSPDSDNHVPYKQPETRRDRGHNEYRLTRSRSITPRERRNSWRNRSRSRDNGERIRKRRRSIQRYEPVNRRRQNASADSPPNDKKEKKADLYESDRRSPERDLKRGKKLEVVTKDTSKNQ
ncbi:unnamed protein product [Blumeria hordei]|uniref:PWI domain-containing protein n=2 Tax=Blumeria hordei TaxID=2867405 RepID=A0A383UKF3_BLUHO|nr:unnamed protein product [Blumeria hordei]